MNGHSLPRPSRPVMPSNGRSTATPQLVLGVFIVALGILLMLDRLDVLAMAARLLRFWPLGLVVLGASMLARRDDSHGRFWGSGWILLGLWLQLNTLGLIRIGFWDVFWPTLMILFGISLIRQTMRGRRPSTGTRAAAPGHLFAVMSESKRIATPGEHFTGSGMTAFMGGCILDLRQASLPPGEEVFVDVLGVMAGHEILVPGGWVVVPDVVNVFAGIDDKRLPMPPAAVVDTPPPVPPRLVIRGFLFMSGLTVKT